MFFYFIEARYITVVDNSQTLERQHLVKQVEMVVW